MNSKMKQRITAWSLLACSFTQLYPLGYFAKDQYHLIVIPFALDKDLPVEFILEEKDVDPGSRKNPENDEKLLSFIQTKIDQKKSADISSAKKAAVEFVKGIMKRDFNAADLNDRIFRIGKAIHAQSTLTGNYTYHIEIFGIKYDSSKEMQDKFLMQMNYPKRYTIINRSEIMGEKKLPEFTEFASNNDWSKQLTTFPIFREFLNTKIEGMIEDSPEEKEGLTSNDPKALEELKKEVAKEKEEGMQFGALLGNLNMLDKDLTRLLAHINAFIAPKARR